MKHLLSAITCAAMACLLVQPGAAWFRGGGSYGGGHWGAGRRWRTLGRGWLSATTGRAPTEPRLGAPTTRQLPGAARQRPGTEAGRPPAPAAAPIPAAMARRPMAPITRPGSYGGAVATNDGHWTGEEQRPASPMEVTIMVDRPITARIIRAGGREPHTMGLAATPAAGGARPRLALLSEQRSAPPPRQPPALTQPLLRRRPTVATSSATLMRRCRPDAPTAQWAAPLTIPAVASGSRPTTVRTACITASSCRRDRRSPIWGSDLATPQCRSARRAGAGRCSRLHLLQDDKS